MEAKLIKTEKGYYLDTGSFDGIHLACYPHDVTKQRLSLKNCQAIERGYDLDKIFQREIDELMFTWNLDDPSEYRSGMYKGADILLKLMGDKKFSEEDINNAMNWIMTQYFEFYEQPTTGRREHYIQSLQQTEWDVEIEMEEVAIGDKYTPEPKPKLDTDGCLILKLKSK